MNDPNSTFIDPYANTQDENRIDTVPHYHSANQLSIDDLTLEQLAHGITPDRLEVASAKLVRCGVQTSITNTIGVACFVGALYILKRQGNLLPPYIAALSNRYPRSYYAVPTIGAFMIADTYATLKCRQLYLNDLKSAYRQQQQHQPLQSNRSSKFDGDRSRSVDDYNQQFATDDNTMTHVDESNSIGSGTSYESMRARNRTGGQNVNDESTISGRDRPLDYMELRRRNREKEAARRVDNPV